MTYEKASVEHRLLTDDAEAIDKISRWVAQVLTSVRFWRLRAEWPDLHQEVLLRVLRSLKEERFEAGKSFKAYVQGVARLTALQSLERNLRQPAREFSERDVIQTVTADRSILLQQVVRQVLGNATDECRSLIRSYFLEEKSYAEISALDDLPVGTVKSRLFRCLQRAHELITRSRAPRTCAGEAG